MEPEPTQYILPPCRVLSLGVCVRTRFGRRGGPKTPRFAPWRAADNSPARSAPGTVGDHLAPRRDARSSHAHSWGKWCWSWSSFALVLWAVTQRPVAGTRF